MNRPTAENTGEYLESIELYGRTSPLDMVILEIKSQDGNKMQVSTDQSDLKGVSEIELIWKTILYSLNIGSLINVHELTHRISSIQRAEQLVPSKNNLNKPCKTGITIKNSLKSPILKVEPQGVIVNTELDNGLIRLDFLPKTLSFRATLKSKGKHKYVSLKLQNTDTSKPYTEPTPWLEVHFVEGLNEVTITRLTRVISHNANAYLAHFASAGDLSTSGVVEMTKIQNQLPNDLPMKCITGIVLVNHTPDEHFGY